jgi:hypothetical protein
MKHLFPYYFSYDSLTVALDLNIQNSDSNDCFGTSTCCLTQLQLRPICGISVNWRLVRVILTERVYYNLESLRQEMGNTVLQFKLCGDEATNLTPVWVTYPLKGMNQHRSTDPLIPAVRSEVHNYCRTCNWPIN